jgi:hypothetical protein
MPSKLVARNRAKAFKGQSGRCHYCDVLMWQGSPTEFARSHGISAPNALLFRCTAEHLRARSDGGRDWGANIVAACWLCNVQRHRSKVPLDPGPYKEKVSALVQAGRGKYRVASDAGLFIRHTPH